MKKTQVIYQKISIKKFYPLVYSLIFISLVAIAVNALKKSGYHITYAVTASIPQGFYLIVPAKSFSRFDMVEFLPPQTILNFLHDKHWAPKSGLILKYVFAVPGDNVCIKNGWIKINNKKIGKIHRFYASKKLLPQTRICGKLIADQYLLLSTRKERSFDSRYFGAILSNRILGKAIPLITKS